MSLDWNEIHASGKKYTELSDAVLDGILLAAGNPKTILEFACGSGDLLVRLAGRGLVMTGTDVSAVALQKSREALEVAGIQANLIEADLNAPGFAEKLAGPYDAAVMRLALAFVADRDAFLTEAKSLLTIGGAFICSTPLLLGGQTYDARQHNISIQKEELEALFARHFDKVELVVPDEVSRPEWPLATYICR